MSVKRRRDRRAATGEDKSADGRCRDVAARNRQDGSLVHPGVGRQGNCQIWLVAVPPGNVKAAQDVELVLENGESTRQDSCSMPRPVVSCKGGDRVGDGVVAEDASRRNGGAAPNHPRSRSAGCRRR